jgi:hypothetical protein
MARIRPAVAAVAVAFGVVVVVVLAASYLGGKGCRGTE